MENAIVLIQSPDRKGLVARVSEFIFTHDANIIAADQYSTDPSNGRFFMRLEFCFNESRLAPKTLETEFASLAATLDAQWEIHYATRAMRMGILVSKQDHCLFDLLYRWRSKELFVDIPFVISNHADLCEIVKSYNIPFYHIPALISDKQASEKQIIEIAREQCDFLVLARYMQILSSGFLNDFGKDIINIHHSFLPSFKGADPYRQAYERGVKIIGATAHYVTIDLDEGPIIEQCVERVSHRDNVDALRRKGRNLEKLALSNAVRAHCEHRIIRYQNKTIVFE